MATSLWLSLAVLCCQRGAVSQEPNPPTWPDSVKLFSPGADAEAQRVIDLVFNENGGTTPPNNGQFSGSRYALLFKPGEYSVEVPVGYYTQVLGLGLRPEEVSFKSARGVFCQQGDTDWQVGALDTFWRGAENFETHADFNWYAGGGSGMLWAASQAVSLRRIKAEHDLMLYQYIPPAEFAGYASGGFMSSMDVKGTTYSGSQQQFFTRNSELAQWEGGVWNMVFVGTKGVPASDSHCGNAGDSKPIISLDTAPVSSEKPFISCDRNGMFFLNVPDVLRDSAGPDFEPGSSTSFERVYVARNNSDSAASINAKLAQGLHLVLTPGVYQLESSLRVRTPGQVLLGLGLATLVSSNGEPCIEVADVDGVRIAGLLLQAGPVGNAAALLVWGESVNPGRAANPGFMQDIYARVGGPDASNTPVACERMVVVNSGHVVGDNVWLWRADHDKEGLVSAGRNPVNNGMLVRGADVSMFGLFVEHTLRDQLVWLGERGRTYFFQCEYPYDVTQDFGDADYAGYRVDRSVTSHDAWGVGVYHYFRDHVVRVRRAISAPAALVPRFVSPLGAFLNGFGVMDHVINDLGGNTSRGEQPGAVVEWYCGEGEANASLGHGYAHAHSHAHANATRTVRA